MKKYSYLIFILFVFIASFFFVSNNKNNLPLVAIANYGPHASLQESIAGFKEEMAENGFIENKTIHYEIRDVGFDPSLIPQMISSLKAKNPKLMLVMTTPVAQVAKAKVQQIPLVYDVITDPVAAGLIESPFKADKNMIGSSDKQDLHSFFSFAKSMLPQMKTIGLLYASAEANDLALVKMMKTEAQKSGIEVIAIPVEQARDVAVRVQKFKSRVDLIYVGTSGPIQPSLPMIAAAAHQMKIPVFNVESQAVKDGLALASFGVDYHAVGRNAGKLAVEIFNGKNINQLAPVYPSLADHHAFVNKMIAHELGIKIPVNLEIAG